MTVRQHNIKFTCAKEVNKKLSFLDISITKVNDKLVANWCFCECEHRLINFNIDLSIDHKRGLIDTHLLVNVTFLVITLV